MGRLKLLSRSCVKWSVFKSCFENAGDFLAQGQDVKLRFDFRVLPGREIGDFLYFGLIS